MNALVIPEPRARLVDLPSRGGAAAVLDFGPPDRAVDLVFCHANGFNARTYRTIIGPLGERLRILAVDLRGHGATTLPAVVEGREGWPAFRDDLLALLDAETEGPVVLSGHSMGGTTCLLAAARSPGHVRALVLFDPVVVAAAAPPGENRLAEGADRRRAVFPSRAAVVAAYTGKGGFRTWNDQQLADYVEAGFRETADGDVTLTCAPAWEASNFRTHNYDPLAAFLAVQCPMTVLTAEIGSTARMDPVRDQLLATGRVRIETVAGTSHFLPMERPELVRETLAQVCAATFQ